MLLQNELIIPFDDPSATTLELSGGKGINLARLAQAGLPVPPGFIIPTPAYQAYVEENQLANDIKGLTPDLDASQIEAVSSGIRARFAAGQIPVKMAAEIQAAYQKLCEQTGSTDIAVAVRSSATAEDLGGASFAGQQDTYLNVQGLQAVLDAVRRCWGSLWTARAIAYRLHQGMAPNESRLAVVIQKMVFADAAGVMFTANPLSGDQNLLVVDATWGLGEALVSGLVTPDHLVLDKSSGKVLERITAVKDLMTVRTDNGTEERPVPHSLRKRPVLNAQTARLLAELGRRVEVVYRRPQDIEWCLEKGRLYLVQARPITTLPEEPLQWTPPQNGLWLHGGGSFEMITEPISPLFATLGLPVFVEAIVKMIAEIGLQDVLPSLPVTILNGYIYLHIDLHLHYHNIPGIIRDFRMHLDSMTQQDSELAEYRRVVAQLTARPIESMASTELIGRMHHLSQAGMRYWLQIMKVVQPIYRVERRFIDWYNRKVRGTGDPDPEIFLRGQKIKPWEAECTLYSLAEAARRSPALETLLLREQADLCAALQSLPEGHFFWKQFQLHLDQYGQQLFSFDLRLPTLADDPRPVLVELNAYLHGKESPQDRLERMQRQRDEAVERILARQDARERNRFQNLLREAQAAARMREDSLFEVGLAWKEMHRDALEVGRRLVEAKVIAQAEDVFFLELAELQKAATDLEAGLPVAEFSGVTQKRQQQIEAWARVQPPYLLPVGSKPQFWWKWVFPMPELQRQPDAHTLIGLGVSPGKVTATARVIAGPEEIDRLKPGEILVARTTTPAWTPLFARAAGLVTDLGGPLAHGSIVAREYGIPAVMGTGSATQKIRDGQTITIMGAEGKVLLEPSQ